MDNELSQVRSASVGGIARTADAPKVGDKVIMVASQWGEMTKFHEGGFVRPDQFLVEIEIKSVKKLKVEYEEVN